MRFTIQMYQSRKWSSYCLDCMQWSANLNHRTVNGGERKIILTITQPWISLIQMEPWYLKSHEPSLYFLYNYQHLSYLTGYRRRRAHFFWLHWIWIRESNPQMPKPLSSQTLSIEIPRLHLRSLFIAHWILNPSNNPMMLFGSRSPIFYGKLSLLML